MKQCRKCGETKPVSKFTTKRDNKDGLRNSCKECVAAYHAAWRVANPGKQDATTRAWYEANKEKRAAYAAAWRADNPEKCLAQQAAYRAANREKRAAANRAWYAANKEKKAAYVAAWRADNSEKRTAYTARRKGLKSGTPEFFALTPEEWLEVLDWHNNQCAYCGSDGPLELEHIIPLSKGGAHTQNNVAPSCVPCNRGPNGKFQKNAVQFMGASAVLLAEGTPEPGYTLKLMARDMSGETVYDAYRDRGGGFALVSR